MNILFRGMTLLHSISTKHVKNEIEPLNSTKLLRQMPLGHSEVKLPASKAMMIWFWIGLVGYFLLIICQRESETCQCWQD
jgi:hypothetical protein